MVFERLRRFLIRHLGVGPEFSAPPETDDPESTRLVTIDLTRMESDQLPLPPSPYFGAGATEPTPAPVSIFYRRRGGFPTSLVVTVAAAVFLLWLGGAARKFISFVGRCR